MPVSVFRRQVVRALVWVPARLRKEFRTRGGDVRFLMWVSFLVAFLWARTWVLFFGPHSPTLTFHDEFQVGSKIVIGGYHPHHIATGVLFLALSGWLSIYFSGRQIVRFLAVLYGMGLGLIVDEIGFIVEGIVPYKDDFPEVFVLVVGISAVMMTTIYFPHFWASLETRVKRLWRRRPREAPPPSAAPLRLELVSMPASAEPQPAPEPPPETPRSP